MNKTSYLAIQSLVLIGLFFFSFPVIQQADAQTAGQVRYSGSSMQFYNGSQWRSASPQSTGGDGTCTGSNNGLLRLSGSTLSYCVGSGTGTGMTGVDSGVSCVGSAGQIRYNSTVLVVEYCKDLTWRYWAAPITQWTCNSSGNWNGAIPPTYYTSTSGTCGSTGSYTNGDTVRCAGIPHPDGCDAISPPPPPPPPSDGYLYQCNSLPTWWDHTGPCVGGVDCSVLSGSYSPGQSVCCDANIQPDTCCDGVC